MILSPTPTCRTCRIRGAGYVISLGTSEGAIAWAISISQRQQANRKLLDAAESSSACNFNTSRERARDSVFPSRNPSPAGRGEQVLRTYFPSSLPPPLAPSFSLSLSLLEESWIIKRTWRCGKRPVASRLARDGGSLARCTLELPRPSASLLAAERRHRRTARRRRHAATHNCVSTRSVCGRLDNVMNVDIFPNADITYGPPLSASTALPLFYHHALSSLRDDVRRYQVSLPRRGMAKTPLLCLWPDSRSRRCNDSEI